MRASSTPFHAEGKTLNDFATRPTTGAGVERLDAPLGAKLGESSFPIIPSDDIPPDVLAVLADILTESHVENPPTRTGILVAKADRAAQYLEWFTPSPSLPLL